MATCLTTLQQDATTWSGGLEGGGSGQSVMAAGSCGKETPNYSNQATAQGVFGWCVWVVCLGGVFGWCVWCVVVVYGGGVVKGLFWARGHVPVYCPHMFAHHAHPLFTMHTPCSPCTPLVPFYHVHTVLGQHVLDFWLNICICQSLIVDPEATENNLYQVLEGWCDVHQVCGVMIAWSVRCDLSWGGWGDDYIEWWCDVHGVCGVMYIVIPTYQPPPNPLYTIPHCILCLYTNCIPSPIVYPPPHTPKQQGPSPDEVALVDAARRLGFVFKGRAQGAITLEVQGKELVFTILNLQEFTSARGCMSVVAKAPDGVWGWGCICVGVYVYECRCQGT